MENGAPLKDIAKGQTGALAYDVQFSAGKMTASLGDSALGLTNVTTLDATIIVKALFAKLPQGTLEEGAEQLILDELPNL